MDARGGITAALQKNILISFVSYRHELDWERKDREN